MMGFITIPQIKVNDIPIYHGDSETILGLGVGHVPPIFFTNRRKQYSRRFACTFWSSE
ncbi:hypothetical protein [Lactococcus cremoris]|uniref:hypothetical protein n=1 Tax=Lactococcus lactis subsp. cremoris TaxID=1359 RepID=UPI0024A76F7C|nr:hypothetical protein [Lactococcus cremoris]